MTNETQKTAVEWYSRRLFEIEIAHNQGVINSDVYVKSKTHALEQAKEMYKDEMEAVRIEICAEKSTSEANKYAEGYKEGYNRAIELTKWTISNLIPPHNEQR